MSSRSSIVGCCLVLTGIGLCITPARTLTLVRGLIVDGLRPGQLAVKSLRETATVELKKLAPQAEGDQERISRLEEELDAERERNRSLMIRLARQSESETVEQDIPSELKEAKRLVLPTLVKAAVLGESLSERWRGGKLIDVGAKKGLRENELVLSDRKPLRTIIDLGEDHDLSTEDFLLLGRCVIGKVENVGRWTSTIQLVTDSRYRARVQLIRKTDSGYVLDAQGILKGQGTALCKLEGISASQSVRVNDAVFTADRDGILPVPLYYGVVVEATLEADDREWTVLVKPVQMPSRLTSVDVVRTAVNPDRLASN
jgi:cell shape-determining protein MreC